MSPPALAGNETVLGNKPNVDAGVVELERPPLGT